MGELLDGTTRGVRVLEEVPWYLMRAEPAGQRYGKTILCTPVCLCVSTTRATRVKSMQTASAGGGTAGDAAQGHAPHGERSFNLKPARRMAATTLEQARRMVEVARGQETQGEERTGTGSMVTYSHFLGALC